MMHEMGGFMWIWMVLLFILVILLIIWLVKQIRKLSNEEGPIDIFHFHDRLSAEPCLGKCPSSTI